MRIRTFIGLAVAAAMALVLATPATGSAQTPTPRPETQAQPPAPSEKTIEGTLVSVDADAKKLTIQPANGAELVIAYTTTTEISGAQKDAAGLATMKDARVTVHFTEDAQTKAKTATRIVVQPRK